MKEELSKKDLYKSPVCREIGIQTNGVLAVSTGERFKNPTDWSGKGSWS